MKIHNIHLLLLSAAVGIAPIALSMDANATTTTEVEQTAAQDLSYFTPRPKLDTRLDFSTWDFMLSETVLYMGPSTRRPAPRKTASVGSRLITGNKSRLRLEGNKILYPLMNDYVKSEFIAYKDELIELGNTYDIPSLPKNDQLAYWINLHNARCMMRSSSISKAMHFHCGISERKLSFPIGKVKMFPSPSISAIKVHRLYQITPIRAIRLTCRLLVMRMSFLTRSELMKKAP